MTFFSHYISERQKRTASKASLQSGMAPCLACAEQLSTRDKNKNQKENGSMAINETVVKRSLIINVEGDTDGKTKSHTYNGIKQDAQADKIHSAATALGGLMEKAVVGVMVNNRVSLDEAL